MKVVRVVVCEIPTIFPQTWQFAVEGIWCGIIRDGRSYLGRPYHTDVTLRPRIRKYFKYENYCCAVLFFCSKHTTVFEPQTEFTQSLIVGRPADARLYLLLL